MKEKRSMFDGLLIVAERFDGLFSFSIEPTVFGIVRYFMWLSLHVSTVRHFPSRSSSLSSLVGVSARKKKQLTTTATTTKTNDNKGLGLSWRATKSLLNPGRGQRTATRTLLSGLVGPWWSILDLGRTLMLVFKKQKTKITQEVFGLPVSDTSIKIS